MKIAVTGSSGFTGKKLVSRLSSLNHDVIKIDMSDGIDISDFRNLVQIPRFDVIYHLAAVSYVPDSYIKPHDFYNINVNATLNTLELCRKYNAKYVYVSSYVYGNPRYLPIDENHPVSAFNPYADTKVISENLCRSYNRFFNLNVAIVRPFNIYGPAQTGNFLIPSIFNQALKGSIEINDPKPRRDLIYIDDLIELYLKILDYNESSIEVFNAGYGKSYSVEEIVNFIIKFFPPGIKVNYLNKVRPNEVQDTVADNSKARKLLGWIPQTDLPGGLSRIYSAMKEASK